MGEQNTAQVASRGNEKRPGEAAPADWKVDTVQVFTNPRAGGFAKRRIAALRRCFTSSGVTLIETESGSSPLSVDERADHVCCAGGDGTLRHVVAAVCRSGRDVSLSVYPNGTVNLIAMESGYPRDPEAFVRRILDGGQRARHYVGLVGDIPMASCASVGPDSYAVATVSSALKRVIGRAAYLFAVSGFLLRWPRAKIMLFHAGGQTACEAVYVAKGRYFAGRWALTPEASVFSPEFDVIALRRASRTDVLRFARYMLTGRSIWGMPGADHFRCTELTIASDDAAPVQADGDIVGHLPVHISIRLAPFTFA
ncbi:diacylglycerol/lipid kinase family protein [Sphingomonas immobilis]|uniref:Diacylglycerol kinase family protein n=1 Tax=Sphingomonas immobilis TaxID=3063997 RepID=A0ABT8ZX52_9SPHN|nr:diacylglycerol kinase family protein [Sphingomonas sp. CA1-15]MDO7841802.1 diacylglycerol kinase family protein [Sphingomonas sp. CA1-15]